MVRLLLIIGLSLTVIGIDTSLADTAPAPYCDITYIADIKLSDETIIEPIFTGVVEATAYTSGFESTGKSPGDPAYGITYTGTQVKEGRTVAVDPKIIPLGSVIVIRDLDGNLLQIGVAEDTGSAIKGEVIDIYIADLEEALKWGRREVHITVYEGGTF